MFQRHKNKIKMAVFCLIFCIIQAPVLLSGECLPTDLVLAVQTQMGDAFLYSKAHTEDTSYYKLQLTNDRAAEVLALGTSRTLQIQGFFFEEDTSFYNAGLMATNLPDILLALQTIEQESLPDVLIVSLDEYFFNEQWYAENTGAFPQQAVTGVELYTSAAIGIYEAIRLDPSFYWKLCQMPFKIGTGAKVYDHGYDQSGAYRYGYVYQNPYPNEIRTQETVEDIQNATGRYYLGDTISADALATLAEIAAFCNAQGITLVTFTPPISQSALEAIEARDDMGYIAQIAPAVSAQAAELGYEFYDFTDPALLEADDDYFIDGFHGSDVIYLRALIAMVEEGSCLAEYVSLDALYEMNETAPSGLYIQ